MSGVDVLAVMDRAANLIYLNYGQSESTPVCEARAALAELIEVATAVVDTPSLRVGDLMVAIENMRVALDRLEMQP